MLDKYVTDLRSPVYYIAGLPKMANAMRALVIGSGVPKDNIRTEEFAGFNMGHSNDVPGRSWKRYVPLVAIVIGVIALAVVHVGAGTLLYKSGFGALSLKNPLVYLMAGLLFVIVLVKLKHFRAYLRSR